MSHIEELSQRYGWPLKIHARGCDAYLVGAQPLNEGDPEPIYRFLAVTVSFRIPSYGQPR